MAITFATKKKAPVAPISTELEELPLSPHAATIDQLGAELDQVKKIENQIKALQEKLKPHQARFKKLADDLNKDLAQTDPDTEVVARGENFEVIVSRNGNQRKIADINALRKEMGDKTFMACASVTLKDIDQYLTDAQKQKVLTNTRTARTIKAIQKRVI